MARRKKHAPLANYPDFAEKYAKHVPEHWVPVAEKMERDEMEKCIVECEMMIETTETDASNNAKIQQLKEDLKYLQEGYKDVVTAQKAKIKFLLFLMNSRGYVVLPETDSEDSLDSQEDSE